MAAPLEFLVGLGRGIEKAKWQSFVLPAAACLFSAFVMDLSAVAGWAFLVYGVAILSVNTLVLIHSGMKTASKIKNEAGNFKRRQ